MMMNNPFTRMSDQQIDQYLHLHQGDPGFIIMLSQAQAAKAIHGRMNNAAAAGAPQQTVKDSLMAGLPSVPNGQQMAETGIAAPNAMGESPEPVRAAGGGIVAFAEGSKGAVRASTSDSDSLQNMAIQNSAKMAALKQQLQQAQAALAAAGNSGDQEAIAKAAQTVSALQDQVSFASQDIEPAENSPWRSPVQKAEGLSYKTAPTGAPHIPEGTRTAGGILSGLVPNASYLNNPTRLGQAYHAIDDTYQQNNQIKDAYNALAPWLPQNVRRRPSGDAKTEAWLAEQAGQPAPAPGILDRIKNYFSSSAPDHQMASQALTPDAPIPTPATAQSLTQVPDDSPTSFQYPPLGIAAAMQRQVPDDSPTSFQYPPLGIAAATQRQVPPSGQRQVPPSGKTTGAVSGKTTGAAPAPSSASTDQMTELKKYMDFLSGGDKETTAASTKALADLKQKIEGQQSKFTPMDQALMTAGFALAGSRSPYLGVGICEAGGKGLTAYQAAHQSENANALKTLELQDTQLKYQTALRRGDMKTAAEMLNQMNMLHRYDQQNELAREQLEETKRFHTGSLGVQRARNTALAGRDQSARLASAYNVLTTQVEKELTGGGGYGQPDPGWVKAQAKGPEAAAAYKQTKIMEKLKNNPPLMKQYLQMGFTPGTPPSGTVANNYAGAEEDDLPLQ